MNPRISSSFAARVRTAASFMGAVAALVLCATPGSAQGTLPGADSPSVAAAPPAVAAAASPQATRLAPRAEIDSLLAYVRGLDGATFLRNGTSHDARQAEAHLRLKWKRQEKAIKTAEDFIARCATRSSITGKAYRIRFADGSVRDAEAVLKERLQRLRGATPATSSEPSAP